MLVNNHPKYIHAEHTDHERVESRARKPNDAPADLQAEVPPAELHALPREDDALEATGADLADEPLSADAVILQWVHVDQVDKRFKIYTVGQSVSLLPDTCVYNNQHGQ